MDKIRKVIRLHRIQSEFCNSKALYRGFIAGRGGGKTYAGALDMLRRAKRGRTYMVASPTGLMMTDTTFPKLRKIAEELGVWDHAKVRLSPYPTATLTTGAVLRFRSADNPDSMRGPDLSGIWLDEGAQMHEDAFKIGIACLREQGEQGWLTVTTTPVGFNHWTYQRFGTEQPNTAIFKCHTRDNPFNPEEFAATLEKQYFGQWALQELGGEFVNMEGAEFDAAWFTSNIWVEKFPPANEILLTIIALDPSKGRKDRASNEGRLGDFSAFVIMKLHKDGTIYIDADMDQRRNTNQIVQDGIRLCIEHRPDAFAMDVDAWQELLAAEFVRAASEYRPPILLPVYGIKSGGVPKEVRIRRLAPLLAGIDGRCRFIANSKGANILVQQLRDWHGPPRSAELHDDGPDCMEMGQRMLLHLLRGSKPGTIGAPEPMGR